MPSSARFTAYRRDHLRRWCILLTNLRMRCRSQYHGCRQCLDYVSGDDVFCSYDCEARYNGEGA